MFATPNPEGSISNYSREFGRPVNRVCDFPIVDLADALGAIETWKSAELGRHELRQFASPGIEPAPEWQSMLHELDRPLRCGFDPDRRLHYWDAIPEFDERIVEALWSSGIPISLDHPAVPVLRSAFREAWLGLIDIIERRRTGAYFSLAPFIGALLSLTLLDEPLTARLTMAAV